jgi:hypothetical protein
MRNSNRIALAAVTATLAGAALLTGQAAGAGTTAPRQGEHRPAAAGFAHPAANPWFPLRPGTVTRLRGHDGAERLTERVVVTSRHRTVQGVRTRVVADVLRRVDGSLAERTHDFYAADHRGTVWYFGERTATYDRQGHVESHEGTWLAGRDGAVAGIVMPAHPRVTDAVRQELLRGHAEDQAWIVQRGLSTTVPYGRVHHALRAFEWTRLEPGVVSMKVYARGLGTVRERDLAGGRESFALVSVRRR